MNKLPFYIALGIAGAAVAALIMVQVRRRNQPVTSANLPSGSDYLFGPDSYASKTFKGFNLNLTLSSNTRNAEAEITALQNMINAYYGTNAVPITGKFDQRTKETVKDITGKSTTSLFEFTYHYLIPERGERAGTDILVSLTKSNG